MLRENEKAIALNDGWRSCVVGVVGLAALATAMFFASDLAVGQNQSDYTTANAQFWKSLLGLTAYSATAFFALRSPGRHIEVDGARREIRIHDQWWRRKTPTSTYQFREISFISTAETFSRSAGDGPDTGPSGYRPIIVLLNGKTIPVHRYRYYSEPDALSLTHAISELIRENAPAER